VGNLLDSLTGSVYFYEIIGLLLFLIISAFTIRIITKIIRKRAQDELPDYKKYNVQEVALLWTKRAFVATIASRVISNWSLMIGFAIMGISYLLSNPLVGLPGLVIALVFPLIGDSIFDKRPFPVDAFDIDFQKKLAKHWGSNKQKIVDEALKDPEVQEYLRKFPKFFQTRIIKNARSIQNAPISRRDQSIGGGTGNI
jgi:predicted NBD/HSP70 family sugar kinase